MRKLLCTVLCLALFAGAPLLPASAAETGSLFRCDTTGNINRSVGENYRFLVTPKVKNARIQYSVGNGKVLRTFVAAKPVPSPEGTKTYSFGFQCIGEGTTGVYAVVNGKTQRLFSVTVEKAVSFSDILGTKAAKYAKVVIQHESGKTALADAKHIQALLDSLAPLRLLKQTPDKPRGSGWEYTLYFYPADGSGAYRFIDTDGFYKDAGCTANGPTGRYLLENPEKTGRIFSAFYNKRIFSESQYEHYAAVQSTVDNGHFPGMLSLEEVAMDYASTDLKLRVADYQKAEQTQGDLATVAFQQNGKTVLEFHLYQPVKTGKTGIWAVQYWVDGKTGSIHQVG